MVNMERARTMVADLRRVGQIPPVSVERIAEIFSLVGRLNQRADAHLTTDSRWISLTDEQITAAHAAILKRSKKRAGVKALVKKYGHGAAERILEKKTGRHIDIR